MAGGCASSGPKFAEIKETLPALDTDKGRIYFYRDASIVGSAVQPEIRLNGEAVGVSQPGGFFFVDRLPGNFEVSTTTEVENKIQFSLTAGQTRYVRTHVSMGILIGRAYPVLIDADQAIGDMANLHYIGDSARLAGTAAKPADTSSASPQIEDPRPGATLQQKPTGTVNMDDLRDLLPAGQR